jgi:hypothetical protein
MRSGSVLKKGFSFIVACSFLASTLFSPARALEEQENLSCRTVNDPPFEELFKRLVLLESHHSGACGDTGDVESIGVVTSDAWGWIVLYNIFMFIYYGRLCLETLDPDPCRAMVNHLFWALFLGVLLEAL